MAVMSIMSVMAVTHFPPKVLTLICTTPPTSSSTYHLTTDLHHANLDGATTIHPTNFCIICPTKEAQKASNQEGNPPPQLYCYYLFSFFLFHILTQST